MNKHSAVEEQITKTLIAGRSRRTILFSAQQFKSPVDHTLHEDTGLHVTAKVGLSELATAPYNGIDEYTKLNIVRLNKGELVFFVLHLDTQLKSNSRELHLQSLRSTT